LLIAFKVLKHALKWVTYFLDAHILKLANDFVTAVVADKIGESENTFFWFHHFFENSVLFCLLIDPSFAIQRLLQKALSYSLAAIFSSAFQLTIDVFYF
jgi:hypothetical protein